MERQEGKEDAISGTYTTSEVGLSFDVCKSCDQGKKIRNEVFTEKPKPQRGKGSRREKCAFYGECLDRAAKKNWKTFNCESCSLYNQEPGEALKIKDKTKNTRICETDECENITLGPNCPLCPSCMAKKSNEKRAARKKKNESKDTVKGKTKACKTEGCENKPQKNGYCRPCNVKFGNHKGGSKKPPEPPIKATEGLSDHEPIQCKDNVISVDFTGYEGVLKKVQELAQEDVRPLNYQVVWLLKEALRSRESE
ncbi:hypothetical protein ACFL0H_05995 [Thermodesulfobacteriota bacterium]